ncbi:MAG: T9SS type A sorting domain-containing protein, partial [Bacteroidales bacterium]|nr:T9SS type A sorting domain-containing protein [Bacteroidales bacterium]
IYTDNNHSIYGCDSVTILTLFVDDIYHNIVYDSICQGDSYPFCGQMLTTAGVYECNPLSMYGCDSITTLHLFVKQPPVAIEITGETDLCQAPIIVAYYHADITGADVYQWTVTDGLILHGQGSADVVIEFPNVDTNYVLTVFGTSNVGNNVCGTSDVLTYTVHVHPTYHNQVMDSICEGETYNFCGQALTTAGTYTCNPGSIYGCDSITTLNLKVTPLPRAIRVVGDPELCPEAIGHYNATIENATDYEWIVPEGFTIMSGQGEATMTLKAPTTATDAVLKVVGSNYCDHSDTLMLPIIIHPAFYPVLEDVACQGERYDQNGFYLESAQNDTTLYQYLFTQEGCDSIVTLVLTVNQKYLMNENAEICQGESYDFHGQILTETCNAYVFLESVTGCDSIILLHLDVHPTYHNEMEATICQGQTYQFGTQTLTEAGVYDENFYSQQGCDSIITLTLQVTQPQQDSVSDWMCVGGEYLFGDTILVDTGIYVRTFSAADGCDSIVVLTLQYAYPQPPIHVTTTDQPGEYIDVTWESDGVEFELYRNGEWLTNVSSFDYRDFDVVQNQEYCYALRMISTLNCTSDLSEVACEVLSNPNALYNAFPNPSSTEVTIVGEDMTQIMLYNSIGKVMTTIIPEHSEKAVLNVSYYETGVYYARITTSEQQTVVIKIIIAR